MLTQVMNGMVDKIIKVVRDLADAVAPRPSPVLVPIPVRTRQPGVERRPR